MLKAQSLQRPTQACLAILLALTIAACGGGGGGDSSAGAQTAPDGSTAPEAGNANPAPPAGAFGGGAGKMMLVEEFNGLDVVEFDLATRTRRVLVRPSQTDGIVGGVSRASANGRFAVLTTRYGTSRTNTMFYQADGTLISSYPRDYTTTWTILTGASISPDGNRAAWVIYEYPGNTRLYLTDATAKTTTVVDLAMVSLPSQARSAPVWTPDGRLLVLRDTELVEIDLATSTRRKLRDLALKNSRSPSITADGKTMWFTQTAGGPYENSAEIWAMNLATGETSQRVVNKTAYSNGGSVFSPDGQWMAFVQQIACCTGSTSPFLSLRLSATRLTSTQLDITNLSTQINDDRGVWISPAGTMAWY